LHWCLPTPTKAGLQDGPHRTVTHGLLLARYTGNGVERRHDGSVAVDRPDTRWCSDGFEIGCDNGERVRVAFTLHCCDREAIAWVATTGGIDSGDIRDLMIESVERRFGLVNRLPVAIEWECRIRIPKKHFDKCTVR
jgi:putative transposase